jgi:asparagine synthase (glutamine-hydrolysing)
MSVQFGRWNFEGQSPSPDYIEKVSAALTPYGPDSRQMYAKDGVMILYRAFHTTKESRREKQPCISPPGAVITWDGRLDNRADLICELRDSLTVDSTDVAIVAAAYEKWGMNCLGKLIGDWALSIWNPRTRSLILAKDFVGTRHLYYIIDKDQVAWSTILDPLVRFPGRTFSINEEYIGGWLSRFPAVHLTPYFGIYSVPPSSFVLLHPEKHIVCKHWDFDPNKRIRYRTDAEYEEHFRVGLATSVRRRLRSDRPILAELSGGMDSSSIVCIADSVARGTTEIQRLDTISWYNESNPGFDERPYFTRVEEKRGRTGCHIDLGSSIDGESESLFELEVMSDRFRATPSPRIRNSELFQQYAAYMMSHGHRVVLSGIGGGEVTGGGVPTPSPELQNLLARGRFFRLTRQLNTWAAKMRTTRTLLFWEAAKGFLPFTLAGVPKEMRPATWLRRSFVRRNQAALHGYPSRVKLLGPLPSFQAGLSKLDGVRRLLAHCGLWAELLREVRYPYLDRDLLEFLYAIPREQLVRVGQRRSLMKRALAGIVPDELLARRQKAFVPQEPRKSASTQWVSLPEIDQQLVSSSTGIIDSSRFSEAFQRARLNQEVPSWNLRRTLMLESWLRHLAIQGFLTDQRSTARYHTSSLEVRNSKVVPQPKSSAS